MLDTLIVVQARVGSSRLYGKVLMPINGEPLIVFLLKRLKKLPFKVILATSLKKENDVLIKWAESINIDAVAGKEEDVLSRYVKCIETYPCKNIVRVTGDNPLTCVDSLKLLIDSFTEEFDYGQLDSLPIGLGSDIYKSKRLIEINKDTQSLREREHLNARFIDFQESYNILNLESGSSKYDNKNSYTVDTLEDYKKVKKIIENNESCHH